jgi:7-cyano-7-deazaguanine synthase
VQLQLESHRQMNNANRKAVVLLSGGLDSATVLALAREQGFDCHSLAVEYGQRHVAELVAAARIATALGAKSHSMVHVDLGTIGGSALTDHAIAVPVAPAAGAPVAPGIPVTYVPARNTVLLALAMAHAEVLGAEHLFIGVNAVDYSGYPDCRPEYIAKFQELARLATRHGVEGGELSIHAPLQQLAKVDIIRLGASLGLDYSMTVSCYQASDAGAACGRCDSCRIRAAGFAAACIPDPTRYRSNPATTAFR